MKTRILIILSLIIAFTAIIVSCQKDEESDKTGQVTFSGNPGSKFSNYYTIIIDGKTKEFEENYGDDPECGTISDVTAFFELPVGTYKYTLKVKRVSYFDDNVVLQYIDDKLSLTITEGSCISVVFDGDYN